MTMALFYLIYEVKCHGAAIFYDRTIELKTETDKNLVSWGITFSILYIMQFADNPMNHAIIDLDVDYLFRRKLFYLMKMGFGLMFFISLYALHALRGCSFSRVTRSIFYLYTVLITIHFLQFILRGYIETDVLSPLYRLNAMLSYFLVTITMLSHPVSQLYCRHKEKVRDDSK